jgi:hypothetical protein
MAARDKTTADAATVDNRTKVLRIAPPSVPIAFATMRDPKGRYAKDASE